MSNKKKIDVTLKLAWLLYDIMNETFMRGSVLKNKDNYKEVALLFASCDEAGREKILRSLKKGFATLQADLIAYLDSVEQPDVANGHLDGSQNLVLKLCMPDNFNTVATTALCEAAHDYLKNLAIAEWYIVTNKEEAAQYMAAAQSSQMQVQVFAGKRTRPQRPVKEALGHT